MSLDHACLLPHAPQIGTLRLESQLWWNLDGGATPVALRLLLLLGEELAPASNRWGSCRAELAANTPALAQEPAPRAACTAASSHQRLLMPYVWCSSSFLAAPRCCPCSVPSA